MKVVHIYKTYLPDTSGGAEQAIRQICRYNANHGIQNEILTVSPVCMPSIIEMAEAKIIRFKTTLNKFSTPMSVDFIKFSERYIRSADILHFHFPWPFGEMNYLFRHIQKPSLVTYHGDAIKYKLLSRLYSPLINRFFKKIDIIVPTSAQYMESSSTLVHFKKKCRVIPLTLDPQRFKPLDEKTLQSIKNQYGEGFFLFVGMLRAYKGLNYLLEAMKDIKARLIIVGNGVEEKRLKKQAEELGLNNVIFAGYYDELLPAFYKLCSVFVFPSCNRAESFGVSLLEASFFGKPMISTELGSGTSYVNKHNETGIVVPPKDVGALKAAIIKLLEDKQLCLKYGENAKIRFNEEFNSEIIGRQYMNLYEELYNKGCR